MPTPTDCTFNIKPNHLNNTVVCHCVWAEGFAQGSAIFQATNAVTQCEMMRQAFEDLKVGLLDSFLADMANA